MSYKLSGGEYYLDGGGKPVKAEYIDGLAQNALLALTSQRHRFYPDFDYGSYIYKGSREPVEEYFLTYARQALAELDGVFAKSAEADGETVTITLLINDTEREVVLPIEEDI